MSLKPFRNIPKDILEWTKWMEAQDTVTASEAQALIVSGDSTTSSSANATKAYTHALAFFLGT